MTLSTGLSLSSEINNPQNNFYDSCIRVDINGQTSPNRYGYDVFLFGISNNGLNYKGCWQSANVSKCNPTKETSSGVSCTYWVLKHGNMDYKYRDVSAEW